VHPQVRARVNFRPFFAVRGRFGASISSFRPSFGRRRLKKVVNFFEKKSAPRQNPDYAYDLSHLVASKFAISEFSWLQRVGSIAREGVQNTHHWCGATETATENGVGQAGSRRYCGSHSSVASSPIIVHVRHGCMVMDILSTVSDCRHCRPTVSNFLLQMLTTWTVTCFL